MKILIGVDRSPHAQAAIDWLKQTTWPSGTRVIVTAVARIPIQAYSEVYTGAGAAGGQAWDVERQACEEIAARAEADLKRAGLKTDARVIQGDPREALVELAKAEGVDLVVVGSHGRTGFTKLLMGSVASHVVTHAPCDVLVIKRVRSE